MGLIPPGVWPRAAPCFALNIWNFVGSAIVPQLLLLSSTSAVSRIGSNLILATSLSFTKVFTTFFSFNLQTCAGILSTSFVPSLYVHSTMIGITKPPLLLNVSSYTFLFSYLAFPSASIASFCGDIVTAYFVESYFSIFLSYFQ